MELVRVIMRTNETVTATAGSTTTTENTAVTGSLGQSGDTDTDVTFSLTSGGGPANGTVSIAANGSFTYTPNTDFVGTNSFTFTVTDEGSTSTAVETITVNNETVTATAGSKTTTENTVVTGSLGQRGDTHTDVTFSLTSGGGPANGTVSI